MMNKIVGNKLYICTLLLCAITYIQGKKILQGKPPNNKETQEYLAMVQNGGVLGYENALRKETWLPKRYKNSWSKTSDEDLPKLYIGSDKDAGNISVGRSLSHNWKDTFTHRLYEAHKNYLDTTFNDDDTYYHYSNNPETIENIRDTLGGINSYEEYKLSKATSDESLNRILADILDEREFNYDLQNSSLSTRILNAGIGLFTAVLDPVSWISIFATTKFVNAGFKVILSGFGRLMFNIFASLAEFEKDLIRERTMAGLKSARDRGRMGGRPKGLSVKAKRNACSAEALYKQNELTSVEIAAQLNISKITLYKYLRIRNVKIGSLSKSLDEVSLGNTPKY